MMVPKIVQMDQMRVSCCIILFEIKENFSPGKICIIGTNIFWIGKSSKSPKSQIHFVNKELVKYSNLIFYRNNRSKPNNMQNS